MPAAQLPAGQCPDAVRRALGPGQAECLDLLGARQPREEFTVERVEDVHWPTGGDQHAVSGAERGQNPLSVSCGPVKQRLSGRGVHRPEVRVAAERDQHRRTQGARLHRYWGVPDDPERTVHPAIIAPRETWIASFTT